MSFSKELDNFLLRQLMRKPVSEFSKFRQILAINISSVPVSERGLPGPMTLGHTFLITESS
ncbi:MAG TPA: hypothetical protein VE593_11500 [Nitrososphaeraceae archaeon]|nr:hypothetical protein [Nitrososphaeraceae archaeon]